MNASATHTLKGRALVTGATGFIGSSVARCLVEAGLNVRVLVRSTSPDRWHTRDVPAAPTNVRSLGWCGLNADIAVGAVFDPGCVKTHTSAKCGKYNSPTRYRAI